MGKVFILPVDELNKVFILTTGEYDDYRIEGVFTSKEEAEAYKAEAPSKNGCCLGELYNDDIEEFELNPKHTR